MLFLYQALSCLARSVTGTPEAGNRRFPSLEHLTEGEDLLEKLFAGPWQQAVEMDLSSFLGQEDILHPWMILDFFEGWPI